jgi:hypothetical protein
MAKPKPIQISIPKPCTENWDEMTPSDKGRFCAHCQKTVIDFTGWSDTALYEFLAQNNGTRMCGRLRVEQVERFIIPHQPQSRLYRLFIGLGLTLVLSQLPTYHTFARIPYSYEYVLSVKDDSLKAGNDTITIKGIVVDENNEPMIGAIIFLYKENVQSEIGSVTDIDGYFEMDIAENTTDINKTYIKVSYSSYKSHKIELAKINTQQKLNIQMEPLSTKELENYIIGFITPVINKLEPGHNRTFESWEIEKMPH